MKTAAFCHLPFTNVRMLESGKLVLCSHQSTEPVLGDLNQTSFDELWFSTTAEDARAAILEDDLHEFCQRASCPFLQSHSRNKKSLIYNEYPISMELDVPNETCDNYCQLLTKMTHVMPNVRSLFFRGDIFRFGTLKLCEALQTRSYYLLDVGSATNGVDFSPKSQADLMYHTWSSSTKVYLFSMDREKHKAITGEDTLCRVKENVINFSKRRTARHRLVLSFELRPENLEEIDSMLELADALAPNSVEFTSYGVDKSNCGIFASLEHELRMKKCRHSVEIPMLLDHGMLRELTYIAM